MSEFISRGGIIGGEQGWQNTGRTTEAKLEGGETCGFIYTIHDIESDFWERFDPAKLVTFNGESYALNDGFISSFATAVRLRMVASGHFKFDAG